MSRKVKYNQEIDGSLTLNDTQDSSDGVIFKGVNQFIHNFHHPTGGGALPVGQNTFIGESAGNFTMGATATSVNDASNNVAIGFEAFESNTLGSFNMAIGTRALEDNTTGGQNVGVGHSALRNNTIGDNNSAIGYNSMFTNTTGEQNVAVGYRTLEDLDGANNNVAIGYAALQELTTGEEMVAIGMNAGRYISGGVTPNTTSTHSIYIGYGTEPSADGNTDEIVIGYNATGNGSNTATIGNTSINDTYLFGQLHTENYSFPTTDGTNTYVLGTNGAGVVSWVPNNSGAFSSNGTTITEAGAEYDVDFVVGSPQLDDDGSSSHDSRMFFDKGKSAFRAGLVVTTYWDNANLGSYSSAFGENTTASGNASHAEGSATVASGYASHAEGESSDATGGRSHAEGNDTTASGSYSHSEGFQTEASGVSAHAQGSNTIASGQNSSSSGSRSDAHLQAMNSNASGYFATEGDSQNSTVQVFRETTNNTTTELTIAGVAPGATSRLILPANRTWKFSIDIAARQTGGTAGTVGDSAGYEIKGVIKRDGSNNTALVGSITKTVIAEDQAAWDVTASADDTNESLKIEVTGETDKTIHWSAKVELVEVG